MVHQCKPHFTNTMVVTSCENNTTSVFASQACLGATHVRMGSCLNNQLNSNDIDMENMTSLKKVLMKWSLVTNRWRWVMKRHRRKPYILFSLTNSWMHGLSLCAKIQNYINSQTFTSLDVPKCKAALTYELSKLCNLLGYNLCMKMVSLNTH